MKKWAVILILTPVLIILLALEVFGINSLKINKVDERENWRITAYGVSDPVVINDVLILSGSQSDDRDECYCLFGLNKSTGEILWSTHQLAIPYIEEAKRLGLDPRMDMEVVSHIDGIIYANLRYFDEEDDVKYVLFAIRSKDGTVLWQADGAVDYDSFSKSVIETDQIFIGDNQGNLLALDSKTGEELWAQKIHDGYYWERGWITYDNNAIFALTFSSECLIFHCGYPLNENDYYQIKAFNAKTGNLVWKSTPLYRGIGSDGQNGYRIIYSHQIFGDILYVESRPSTSESERLVTAIDLETGVQRWEIHFTDTNRLQISTSSRQEVFFLTTFFGGGINKLPRSSKITAVDKFTGKVIWRFNENALRGELVYLVNDNAVYIGVEDGYIYALESGTGNVIWSIESGYLPIHFVRKQDSLFVFYEEGFVTALDPKTGAMKWTTDLGIDRFWKTLNHEIFQMDDKFLFVSGNFRKTIFAVDLETGEILWSWEHFWPVRADLEINLVDDNYLYVEQNPRWSNWSKLFGEHWFFVLKINP